MEPNEAAEQLEKAHQAAEAREGFTRVAAVVVAVLAALLAVATLAANQAEETTILDQQKASDAFNELQANSLKRHLDESSAAVLRAVTAGTPQQAAAQQQAQRLDKEVRDKYRPNEDRLLPVARDFERRRDRAEAQHRDLQFSEVGFQVGIVMSSVAILVRRSLPMWLGVALGIGGLLLLLNGGLMLVALPHALEGG
jgi:hypothetical protein